MRRRKVVVLIALGVLVFLAISIALARWLSLENVERDDMLSVLRAEVRGDAASIFAQLHACESTSCRSNVHYDARALKRRGSVLILSVQSQTAYALTSAEGWTRVAWKVGSHLPVVQCFRVARKGNAISGLTVTLLRVSRPIHPLTADC